MDKQQIIDLIGDVIAGSPAPETPGELAATIYDALHDAGVLSPATPALLAACEAWVSHVDTFGDSFAKMLSFADALAKTRAAIAQARGEGEG
jgi:hypothetical protein